MTLSFKTQINSKPTYFVEKILDGFYQQPNKDGFWGKCLEHERIFTKKFGHQLVELEGHVKIHTIRSDKSNRWKTGNKIHFVINNRTPDRFQFAPVTQVISIQKISINHRFGSASLEVLIDDKIFAQYHYGNDDNINEDGLFDLIQNDGFDSIEDFASWFKEDFEGKIIHWTNKIYSTHEYNSNHKQ